MGGVTRPLDVVPTSPASDSDGALPAFARKPRPADVAPTSPCGDAGDAPFGRPLRGADIAPTSPCSEVGDVLPGGRRGRFVPPPMARGARATSLAAPVPVGDVDSALDMAFAEMDSDSGTANSGTGQSSVAAHNGHCLDKASPEAPSASDGDSATCSTAKAIDRLAALAEAARTAEAAVRSDARAEAQRTIFGLLDADGSGHLDCRELKQFVELMGFDGSDEEWQEEFSCLLESHGDAVVRGFAVSHFQKMLDDDSDEGMHCTDKELSDALAALTQKCGDQLQRLLDSAQAALIELDPAAAATAAASSSSAADPPAGGDAEDDEDADVADEGAESGSDAASSADSAGNEEQLGVLETGWEAPDEDGEEGDEDEAGEAVGDGEEGSPSPSPTRRRQPSADPAGAAGASSSSAGAPGAAAPPVVIRCGAAVEQRRRGADSDGGDAMRKRPRLVEEAGKGPRPTPSPASASTRSMGASAASSSDTLQGLRRELVDLGSKEAMRDRQRIPNLAKSIARTQLQAAGPSKVFDLMATVFQTPGMPPRHRLCILYVFHELLINQVQKSDRPRLAQLGTRAFLDVTAGSVAETPAEKRAPFMKLIGTWGKFGLFSEGYLHALRAQWAERREPQRRPPGYAAAPTSPIRRTALPAAAEPRAAPGLSAPTSPVMLPSGSAAAVRRPAAVRRVAPAAAKGGGAPAAPSGDEQPRSRSPTPSL